MKLSYWKRYDRVFKLFSHKKIYNKILGFANNLGKPFEKKGKRGPKFKIKPEEYASYIAYKGSKGEAYRDMELDSETFFEKNIDHSTFGKNFQKIPYDYLRKLLQLTGKYLEKLLGHTKIHIPDSTKLSTDRYKDIIYQGKHRRVRETFKLHTMVQRHPKKQMTIIMDGIATTNHISDADGAVCGDTDRGLVEVSIKKHSHQIMYILWPATEHPYPHQCPYRLWPHYGRG